MTAGDRANLNTVQRQVLTLTGVGLSPMEIGNRLSYTVSAVRAVLAQLEGLVGATGSALRLYALDQLADEVIAACKAQNAAGHAEVWPRPLLPRRTDRSSWRALHRAGYTMEQIQQLSGFSHGHVVRVMADAQTARTEFARWVRSRARREVVEPQAVLAFAPLPKDLPVVGDHRLQVMAAIAEDAKRGATIRDMAAVLCRSYGFVQRLVAEAHVPRRRGGPEALRSEEFQLHPPLPPRVTFDPTPDRFRPTLPGCTPIAIHNTLSEPDVPPGALALYQTVARMADAGQTEIVVASFVRLRVPTSLDSQVKIRMAARVLEILGLLRWRPFEDSEHWTLLMDGTPRLAWLAKTRGTQDAG